jgi:broad specificity phosphatase PhoE
MTARQRIVLVRHGETEWSRDGRHTGRTDVPLTDKGRRSAAALREALSGWTFAAVLTSPLQRAKETCALAGFGDVAQRDDDLVEWDYGQYEGMTAAEIRTQRSGWNIWKDGVIGGETLDDVAQRAGRVIAAVTKIDGDVALFAHGHVLRILTARYLEMPAHAGRRFVLRPTAPSVLGHEHEWRALLSWNLEPSAPR